MALLVDRIVDYTPDANYPTEIAAFTNPPYYVSPNDKYCASWFAGPEPFVCVADLETLEVIQNFNIGFTNLPSELLPSVTSLDLHAACIDNEGSLWLAAGEGTGEVFELPLGELDTPIYKFTLETGGGGDSFWFSRASRSFDMPDGTTKILFVEFSETEPVFDYHLWDKDAETYSHVILAWTPTCSFQDSNGDIWIAGTPDVVDGASITIAYFKRLTDVTGTSTYPADQTFTGLPDIPHSPTGHNTTSLWGGFNAGTFVGGWHLGHTAAEIDVAATCNYLIKLVLDNTNTKTVVDISSTAPMGFTWGLPCTIIPSNQGFLSLCMNLNQSPDQRKFGFFSATDFSLTTSYDLDDWDAGDDLFSESVGLNRNALGDQYLYTREAFMAQSYGIRTHEGVLSKFGHIWLYYFGDAPSEGEDESDDLTLRCWTYSLDGHDFYVLRLGTSETLVYDLTTDQWCSWKTTNRDNWRAHVGQNWVGMQDTLATYATDVVAGDDIEGLLWILNPDLGQDDNTAGDGIEYFPRVVAGGVAFNGREVAPCNALTLCLSLGAPMLPGQTISLRTSDDYGNTWIEHGSVLLADGRFDQVVEWYSLGLMGQPGRIFEISDRGASVRIGRADLR